MTRLESLIEQLKTGSETDKAEALLEILTADPTSDFIADGYVGDTDLSAKGGVYHLHDEGYKNCINVKRLHKRSYYKWNIRLVDGPMGWFSVPNDIVVKFDKQDATFIKGFISIGA